MKQVVNFAKKEHVADSTIPYSLFCAYIHKVHKID